MPKVYAWPFQVRSYDLNVTGQVGPAAFLNYFEEAATQASAANGFDYRWYEEAKRAWVVRKMTVRYYDVAVRYGEALEITTWVSDFRRVQSNRDYDLHRADGTRIAKARANWIFINTETMQPQRLPAEFADAFILVEGSEPPDVGVLDPTPVEQPLLHQTLRRVQRYELDSNAHVNNAVYLTWAEQALTDSLRAVGWPPERLAESPFVMSPFSSEIEYLRSAVDDEPISLTTHLTEVGQDRAAWQCGMTHGTTGETLARAVIIRAFTNAQGSCPMPEVLQSALVERSASRTGR
ncbi:MAG: thioesterase family protein [Chloroflexota bacterium]